MKVIAIDPGYDRVGIAILEKKNGIEKVIYSECFISDRKKNINKRIFLVGERVNKFILEFSPDYLAIESLFFSKNTKTALSVAEARGVIIYQGIRNNLPIYEYTPNQIKLAVAGYGNASKSDILYMVEKLVKINKRERIDDELDAIAIALTFLASVRV